MSCFWIGLLSSLRSLKNNNFSSPLSLVQYMKKHNQKTNNIIHQNQDLSVKEKSENFQAIQVYNPQTINQGYWCSTCDPFLLLFAELFTISLEHNYNNHRIVYYNNGAKNIAYFRSNTYHFSFVKIGVAEGRDKISKLDSFPTQSVLESRESLAKLGSTLFIESAPPTVHTSANNSKLPPGIIILIVILCIFAILLAAFLIRLH